MCKYTRGAETRSDHRVGGLHRVPTGRGGDRQVGLNLCLFVCNQSYSRLLQVATSPRGYPTGRVHQTAPTKDSVVSIFIIYEDCGVGSECRCERETQEWAELTETKKTEATATIL